MSENFRADLDTPEGRKALLDMAESLKKDNEVRTQTSSEGNGSSSDSD